MAGRYATNLVVQHTNRYNPIYQVELGFHNIDAHVKVADFQNKPYVHINRKTQSVDKKQYVSFDYYEWKEFMSGASNIDKSMAECKAALQKKGKWEEPRRKRKHKIEYVGNKEESSETEIEYESDDEPRKKKAKTVMKKKSKQTTKQVKNTTKKSKKIVSDEEQHSSDEELEANQTAAVEQESVMIKT